MVTNHTNKKIAWVRAQNVLIYILIFSIKILHNSEWSSKKLGKTINIFCQSFFTKFLWSLINEKNRENKEEGKGLDLHQKSPSVLYPQLKIFLASFPWKLLSKDPSFVPTDRKTKFLILKAFQWHIICPYLGKTNPPSELIFRCTSAQPVI